MAVNCGQQAAYSMPMPRLIGPEDDNVSYTTPAKILSIYIRAEVENALLHITGLRKTREHYKYCTSDTVQGVCIYGARSYPKKEFFKIHSNPTILDKE